MNLHILFAYSLTTAYAEKVKMCSFQVSPVSPKQGVKTHDYYG